MAMICPRCQQVYDQQLVCRECGGRLQFQADHLDNTPGANSEPFNLAPYTPWTKIGIGLLLALGLSYGLQQLFTAGLVASTEIAAAALWSTLGGLILLHALQGASLIVGGAITGAGQQRGILYGSVVGLLGGAIFLAMQRPAGDGPPDVLIFAQPIVHALFGMLGGLVGMIIWKPPPTLPLVTNVQGTDGPSSRTVWHLFRGRVHYGRVFIGVFIVVAGVVWSSVILDRILRATNGSLVISSHLQARLIGWEIAALATLLGAAVAGATTFNGFKQGVCVGVGAVVVIIGMQLGNDTLAFESFLGMLGSVVALSIAGGWFGGQLFPPVMASRRRRLSHL
jgi:hypothetical protein